MVVRKSCDEVKSWRTKGLKAFQEEFPQTKLVMVSFDKYRRTMNDVDIVPVAEFLKLLWKGEII